MQVINPIQLTDAMFVSSSATEADYAAYSATALYAAGDRCIVVANTHKVYEALQGKKSTVTMTIAAPCVVSWVGHGLAADTPIVFTTTGALPTGLVAGTTYYVIAVNTITFQVSATIGGSPIATTGTQSPTHTCGLALNYGANPTTNLTGITPVWLEVSSTNRWNMFDQQNSTQTIVNSTLTVVIKPGLCNSLALMEIYGGTATVSVKDVTGGTVVYSESKILDGSIIVDWYTYFFEPFNILDTWVLSNVIPPYPNPEITMTLTTSSGTAKCGVMVAGTSYDIGAAQYGASFGITDYSVKSTNTYGATSIVKRKYSKKMDVRLEIANTALNQVSSLLSNLRSTPAVWVGTSDSAYAPLVVYGFYKDWSVEITYFSTSLVTLSIEGLT